MDQPTIVEFTPVLTEVASGLAFPEGPIWMSDGSIVLVEMFGPRLTRVHPDGTKETIAEVPGGPNGAAVGPDGAFYVYAHVPQFTTALGIDSLQLTARWLHEIGVAATSGVDFDLARGHEHVRFSYAGSGADMVEACELLAGWTP